MSELPIDCTKKNLDSCDKDLKLRYIESIYLKFEKQSLNTQEWSIPLNIM